jgi:predicted O-methyltransferase YrrM
MEPTIENYVEDGIAYTKVNGTRGTLNFYDAQTLISHAKQLSKDSKYIETGSYLGCSSLLITLYSNATVWAHDIWVTDWSELKGCPPPEVKDYFYEFYSSVKNNKRENRVIPIRGNSVYTIGIHDDASIDLAFVDGDHSYEGCLYDLRAVWPKMKKDSVILVHDCVANSGPLSAVKTFTQEKNVLFEIIPETWGMVRIISR